MGAISSKIMPIKGVGLSLLDETKEFVKWTVEDVRQLHWNFKTLINSFSLVEPQFECVMAFKKMKGKAQSEKDTTHVPLSTIFKALDNDKDGRVDGLELISGLALICQGSLEERARLCFEIFDFNLNSVLSKEEVVMLLQSILNGVNVLIGGDEDVEPPLREIENLANNTMLMADTDKSKSISYEEFIQWTRMNPEVISFLDAIETLSTDLQIFLDDENFHDSENNINIGNSTVSSNTEDPTALEEDGFVHDAFIAEYRLQDAPRHDIDSFSSDGIDQSVAERLHSTGKIRNFYLEPMKFPTRDPFDSSHDAPRAGLVLEWCHGYRGFDCRNNLKYLSRRKSGLKGASGASEQESNSYGSTVNPSTKGRTIVYPAAAMGIVYDVVQNTQRFFKGHTDDIISLAQHPAGNLIATGQVGKDPVIMIWDPVTLLVHSILLGFHEGGVCLMAFSNDGCRIASIGLDSDHSLALHDWESRKLLASGTVHQNRPLGLTFSNDDRTVAIVGVKFLRFLTVEGDGRSFIANKGKLGNIGRLQTFTCVQFVNNDAVVGTLQGEIYRFDISYNLTQVVQAQGYGEPLLCLSYTSELNRLVTGGYDGLIVTLDDKLMPVGPSIDLTAIPLVPSSGRTTDTVSSSSSAIVSIHKTEDFIIVGTRGGEILEISTSPEVKSNQMLALMEGSEELFNEGKSSYSGQISSADENLSARVLIHSHSEGELWGLCPHPKLSEFATAGDDKCVRIWSLRRLHQTKVKVMPQKVRSLCYSPCGSHLAVGMIEGPVAILDSKSMKIITLFKDSSNIVHDIAYSPNGSTLAVGCRDCNIYIYYVDVEKNIYSRRSVCMGHHHPIRYLSFSLDSKILASCSEIHNLLFWDTSGNICYDNAFIREVQWGTWSSPVGWSVQGVWKDAVVVSVTNDLRQEIVATGTSFGEIQLFRYPCISNKSIGVKYSGHSSPVTKIRFTSGDRYLLSIGGSDNTVLQWRYEKIEDDDSSDSEDESNFNYGENKFDEDGTPLDYIVPSSEKAKIQEIELPHRNRIRGNQDAWLSAKIPSAPSGPVLSSTDVDLELHWAIGVKSKNVRDAVRYTASGDIVYSLGALGVVVKGFSSTKASEAKFDMSFLQGAHRGEISALAIHPNGQIVATGDMNVLSKSIQEELGARGKDHRIGKVSVWDSEGKNVLVSLAEDWMGNGISYLAFDKSGEYLAVAIIGENHTVGIFQWRLKRLVALRPTGKDIIHSITFLDPEEKDVSAFRFITCGTGPPKLWTVRGKTFLCQKGFYKSYFKNEFEDTTVVRNYLAKIKNEAQIIALKVNSCLLTSGVDGTLYIWICSGSEGKTKFKLHHVYSPREKESPHEGAVQCGHVYNQYVLTGDCNGTIVLWKAQEVEDVNTSLLYTQMRIIAVYSIKQYKAANISLLSVCLSGSSMVLAATSDGEIVEFSIEEDTLSKDSGRAYDGEYAECNLRLVQRGHGNGGEVWAVDIHPHKPIIASGGDDGYIRFWDLDERVEKGFISLRENADETPIESVVLKVIPEQDCKYVRAIAFYPNPHISETEFICYGTSTGVIQIRPIKNSILYPTSNTGKSKEGEEISGLRTYAENAHIGDESKMVMQLKFTKDWSHLVAGLYDGSILIFQEAVESESKKIIDLESPRILLNAHSSFVASISFARVESSGKENELAENEDLRIITASSNKEMKVWSFSDTIREEVSTDILEELFLENWTHCVGWHVDGIIRDREENDEILSVDLCHEFDTVNVMAVGDAKARITLYPWPGTSKECYGKNFYGHAGALRLVRWSSDDRYLISVGERDGSLLIWSSDVQEEKKIAVAKKIDNTNINQYPTFSDYQLEEIVGDLTIKNDSFTKNLNSTVKNIGGDEFSSTQPWLGAIREPSWWDGDSTRNATAPNSNLELSFVYGYQGQRIRNGVLYGPKPNEIIYPAAALGVVFNSNTHKQLYNNSHSDDIVSIAVNQKRGWVATGEIGRKPQIILWDSNSGSKLKGYIGIHARGIAHLAFSPSGHRLGSIGMDDNHTLVVYNTLNHTVMARTKVDKSRVLSLSFGSDVELVAAGVRFIKFITLSQQDSSVKEKKGIFGKANNVILSVAFLGSDCITGSADGHIYRWKSRSINTKKKAHTGPVTCLYAPDDGVFGFVSGGQDGYINIWKTLSETPRKIHIGSLPGIPTPYLPEIQSLCCMQSYILVGTKSSDIIEIHFEGDHIEAINHVSGHYKEELWGLAAHPLVNRFATIGDEGTVRIWNSHNRKIAHSRLLRSGGRAIAYHPQGHSLAVALYSGDLIIISEDLTEILCDKNVSKSWCQSIAYSPDSRTLAVGSHDRNIYLINAVTFARKAICRGHSSYITHLDFSLDSKILQSNCGGYELLFWNTHDGGQIKSANSTKDVQWATFSCALGWPVQGIWPACSNGTDVNSVARSNSTNLLATGDDFGKVKLFHFPCIKKGSKFAEGIGHSSHVTNVVWNRNDKYLFTAGGKDRCIMQWKLRPSSTK